MRHWLWERWWWRSLFTLFRPDAVCFTSEVTGVFGTHYIRAELWWRGMMMRRFWGTTMDSIERQMREFMDNEEEGYGDQPR